MHKTFTLSNFSLNPRKICYDLKRKFCFQSLENHKNENIHTTCNAPE